jgi:hypothetical protein
MSFEFDLSGQQESAQLRASLTMERNTWILPPPKRCPQNDTRVEVTV